MRKIQTLYSAYLVLCTPQGWLKLRWLFWLTAFSILGARPSATASWHSTSTYNVASYLGLLTPVFVACSTNVWKTVWRSSCVVTNLDIRWICWGVAHSFCTTMGLLSELEKYHKNGLMSAAQSPWSVVVIRSTLTCSHVAFLGMCHFSTCPPNVQVCHCMSWALADLPPQ